MPAADTEQERIIAEARGIARDIVAEAESTAQEIVARAAGRLRPKLIAGLSKLKTGLHPFRSKPRRLLRLPRVSPRADACIDSVRCLKAAGPRQRGEQWRGGVRLVSHSHTRKQARRRWGTPRFLRRTRWMAASWASVRMRRDCGLRNHRDRPWHPHPFVFPIPIRLVSYWAACEFVCCLSGYPKKNVSARRSAALAALL